MTPSFVARGSSNRVVVAEAALVGVAAVWGLTFVMVKDAVQTAPVAAFLAYRFLPAAAIVGAVAHRNLRRLPARGWAAGAVMGIFLTAGYAFQTAGLQYTSASKAGFITGLFVVLTPLFHAIGSRTHRLSATSWAAAALATAGLWLMTDVGGTANKGDVLVFFCACSFALHILATNWAAARYPVGVLVAVQLGVCGVAALVYGGATSQLDIAMTAAMLRALAVTAVLASAVAFLVQTYAQQHVAPARTALVLASEPAFAGLFGFLLAGDRLGIRGWTGAALITAAIAWAAVATEEVEGPALLP